MADKIGSIGDRLDIDIRVGDTLGPFAFQITEEDGVTPVNLTGSTFSGKASLLDDGTGADIALTINPVNLANGDMEFVLEDTSAFESSGDFLKTAKKYAYLIDWTNTAGHTKTVLCGYINTASGDLP